jgi:Flp pilus assembly pilin Flp
MRLFLADERGAELVEQALLILLVALGGLAVLLAMRDQLAARFTELLAGLGMHTP